MFSQQGLEPLADYLRHKTVPAAPELRHLFRDFYPDCKLTTETAAANSLSQLSSQHEAADDFPLVLANETVKNKCHQHILDIGEKLEKRVAHQAEVVTINALAEAEKLFKFECCQRLEFTVREERKRHRIASSNLRLKMHAAFRKLTIKLKRRLEKKRQTSNALVKQQCVERHKDNLRQILTNFREAFQRETDKRVNEEVQKIQIVLQKRFNDQIALREKEQERIISRFWDDCSQRLESQRNALLCREMAELVHVVCTQKIHTKQIIADIEAKHAEEIQQLHARIVQLQDSQCLHETPREGAPTVESNRVDLDEKSSLKSVIFVATAPANGKKLARRPFVLNEDCTLFQQRSKSTLSNASSSTESLPSVYLDGSRFIRPSHKSTNRCVVGYTIPRDPDRTLSWDKLKRSASESSVSVTCSLNSTTSESSGVQEVGAEIARKIIKMVTANYTIAVISKAFPFYGEASAADKANFEQKLLKGLEKAFQKILPEQKLAAMVGQMIEDRVYARRLFIDAKDSLHIIALKKLKQSNQLTSSWSSESSSLESIESILDMANSPTADMSLSKVLHFEPTESYRLRRTANRQRFADDLTAQKKDTDHKISSDESDPKLFKTSHDAIKTVRMRSLINILEANENIRQLLIDK